MFRFTVALAIAITAADAHSKCAMVELSPHVITPKNAAIAPGGGVLIGIGYDHKQATRAAPKVEQKTWRFRIDGKLVEPTIKVLAPSLAVYELFVDRATLVDDARNELVTVTRLKQAPAPLPAPAIKSAAGKMEQDHRSMATRLQIDLSSPPPPGAIGLIVYSDKTAVNWTAIDSKVTTVRLQGGGHCSNDLPGTSVPFTGTVSIAWFDASGRVSAPSNEARVKNL